MGEPNHCYLRDNGLQFMAFHTTGLFLYSLKHQKTRGYERSRGRHWKCSIRKGILKISHNSQENTCARVTFLLKKRLWHWCFPVEIFKNIFLQNTSGRLLLKRLVAQYELIATIHFFKLLQELKKSQYFKQFHYLHLLQIILNYLRFNNPISHLNQSNKFSS